MTMKVHRLSQKGIESIRRGLRRSWVDGTHRQRQQQREADADTVRSRALWDRKGSAFADIRFPSGQLFRVYWSTRGRTDQVDVFHDGRKIATCSPSRIFKEINL